MVESYLQTREGIRLVILILDARRGASPEDLTLLDWLEYHQIPSLIVLTKADKLSQFERARQKKDLGWPSLFWTGKPLFLFCGYGGGEGRSVEADSESVRMSS